MTTLPQRLAELARRVERNLPDHRDPETFHAEKSEIVRELKEIEKETKA